MRFAPRLLFSEPLTALFFTIVVEASCLVTIADPPAQTGATGTGAAAGTSAAGGAAGGPRTYRDEVLADHPIGYWRLNDDGFMTALDSSTHHHDGQYVGNVVFQVVGAIANDPDKAVEFEGGYIDAGHVSEFDFPAHAPFTLEAWIRPDPGDGGPPKGGAMAGASRGVTAADAGSYDGYIWAVQNGKLKLHRTNSALNQSDTAEPSNIVIEPVYTHIVTAFDGTNVYHYVNDAAQPPEPSPAELPSGLSLPFLIANAGGWGAFWGTIDELAVYDYVLPANRVDAHYKAGSGMP